MANPEHVEILKQGVEVWNKWREANVNVLPDLSQAHLDHINLAGVPFSELPGVLLHYAHLMRAHLSHADLYNADLSHADLSHADLSFAHLMRAQFRGAHFHGTSLSGAYLRGADLSHADLSGVGLSGAILNGADLSHADLSFADLSGVDLSGAILNGTNLQNIFCGSTIFSDIDLSMTKGLETVNHYGPSTLGMDTYFKSRGKIPELFLKGCGLPETLITYLPSMLEEAIQFYSCFISYSHEDKEFAKRLHDRLQGVGIRCWLDEHQLKPGDELHKTIYEGIRVYDKVILCCSETALKSWWVEKEFKNAISKEEDYTETVLIPITLDDYIFKQSADSWTIGEIRRRFVQDFSKWKEHDAFEQAFKKVVEALKTKGSQLPPPTSKLTRRI